MQSPAVPRYEASCLSDVLPSIGTGLGLGGENVLGLTPSDRYVVLLIDGLGAVQLAHAAEDAPFLAGFPARTITTTAPSTTVTALTSLGTGLAPGQHGLAGFSFRQPFSGGLLNALAWEPGLSGLDLQPRLTMFEKLTRAGVAAATVIPAKFAGTGLTQSGLRGARVYGVTDETDLDARARLVVDAATASDKTLVYAYERALDHAGHAHGVASPQWRQALRNADALASMVRAALPGDVRLLVTADHGMVDIPLPDRFLLEDEPDLAAGVQLMGGEARFRHLYTTEPDAVASRWRDRLGEAAWVRTRDEASEAGWFGYLAPSLASRFGDVVVAMTDRFALMTRRQPKELKLVGMHGSLTEDELLVPLIVE